MEDDEITPEMIAAGASVLYGFCTFYDGEETWAVRVYEAMRAARGGGGAELTKSPKGETR